MNILFYLVPKSEVMYLYDDYSLRQAMEKPGRELCRDADRGRYLVGTEGPEAFESARGRRDHASPHEP